MSESLRLGTSSRRLDVAATQQGVERECPFRPEFHVTILPFALYNPRFRIAVQAHAARKQWNGESKAETDNGQAAEFVADSTQDPRFVVEALVAGMRGLFNAKGNEVKYTEERGLAILSDPANADVMQWIVNEARNYGQFYTQEVEDAAGN